MIDRLLHLVFGCHCEGSYGNETPCINLALGWLCRECRLGHPHKLKVVR